MPKIISVKITWKIKAPKTIHDILILVISGLTQYVSIFSKPTVDVNTLKGIKADLDDKYSKRTNGEVGKKDYADALKKADEALRKNAKYVNEIANGDETVILKSGYTPTKDTAQQATTVPAQAGVPDAKATLGGFLTLNCDEIVGATSYTYLIFFGAPFAVPITDDFITVPAESTIKLLIVGGGKRSITIKGLSAGQQVHVQVLGHNSVGYGPIGAAFPVFTI